MNKILNFEVLGEDNGGKPVIIAHGLFGSLKNWRSIAKYLAHEGYQVIICDMRNHGLSFWDDSHRYEDMADDLRSVIAKFGGVASVIGHSMGGKAAMMLALLYPTYVHKLAIVDIAPVTYKHNQANNIDALESIDLRFVKSRQEFSKKLGAKIGDPMLINFFCQSVDFSDPFQSKWFLNLRALKKNLPAIMSFPNSQLRNLGPTLIVRGAISDYIRDEYRSVLKNYFPNFFLETVENASHWLHTEKPKEFREKLTNFLKL